MYIKSPNKLIKEATALLNNPDKLNSYTAAIKRANLRNGVHEVAGYLNEMSA